MRLRGCCVQASFCGDRQPVQPFVSALAPFRHHGRHRPCYVRRAIKNRRFRRYQCRSDETLRLPIPGAEAESGCCIEEVLSAGVAIDAVAEKLFGRCEKKCVRIPLAAVGKRRNSLTPASREWLLKRFKALEIAQCPFANLPESRAGRWGQGIPKR